MDLPFKPGMIVRCKPEFHNRYVYTNYGELCVIKRIGFNPDNNMFFMDVCTLIHRATGINNTDVEYTVNPDFFYEPPAEEINIVYARKDGHKMTKKEFFEKIKQECGIDYYDYDEKEDKENKDEYEW